MINEVQPKPKIHFEFYIDKDGNPHFWTHIDGDVTFQEMENALLTLKVMIEYQIENKEKCPFHKMMANSLNISAGESPAQIKRLFQAGTFKKRDGFRRSNQHDDPDLDHAEMHR